MCPSSGKEKKNMHKSGIPQHKYLLSSTKDIAVSKTGKIPARVFIPVEGRKTTNKLRQG